MRENGIIFRELERRDGIWQQEEQRSKAMKKEAQTMKKRGVQGEVKERICQRERQNQDAHGRR